jgi:hypothetical protein
MLLSDIQFRVFVGVMKRMFYILWYYSSTLKYRPEVSMCGVIFILFLLLKNTVARTYLGSEHPAFRVHVLTKVIKLGAHL